MNEQRIRESVAASPCERATLGRYTPRRLAADGDRHGLPDEQGRPARARPRHLSLHRAHRRNRAPVRAALGGSAAAIVVATAPNARAQPRSAGRTEGAQPNGGTLKAVASESGNGRQHRLRHQHARQAHASASDDAVARAGRLPDRRSPSGLQGTHGIVLGATRQATQGPEHPGGDVGSRNPIARLPLPLGGTERRSAGRPPPSS